MKQQLDSLGVAEAQLKKLRQLAKGRGSRKTDPSDETLYHLASIVRQETGSYQLAKIATLLQVANSAHGEAGQVIDAETLKKRLHRFEGRHRTTTRS